MFHLGMLNYKKEQDYEESMKWFQKGIDHGSAKCWCGAGFLYGLGLGVEKNPQVFKHYYEQAINRGSSIAASSLGLFFFNGRRVEHFERAVELFQKAIEMGDTSIVTYECLGKAGKGVQRNFERAAEMLEKAVELKSVRRYVYKMLGKKLN